MKIFSGSAHPELSKEIADYLHYPLGEIELREFPDGESFCRIRENIRGRDVFVVQPTSPPASHNLMELLIIMDACRRASASRITAVLPYFGYARQDRKDQPRVPISAKLVANMMVAAGATRILTMDLHSQQIQGFFDIPVDHLYASPVIVKYLREKNLDNMVVVSPDVGGVKMASAYANKLDAGLAIVAKQRQSATQVEIVNIVGDVDGCNCVLVDDMTSTAGTLAAAAAFLKEKGAKSVMAAVSHTLLVGNGHEKIMNSPIDELVTTNSVPASEGEDKLNVSRLSIAQVMGDAILRIHNNQSVTSLFRI